MPPYTDLDVLFGRGKVVQIHPGNIRFRNLIGEHKAEFKGLRNDGSKKEFTRKVLLEITNGGEVKFMKKKKACDDTWIEASDREAFNKVHHVLRGEKRKSKAASTTKLTGAIQQDPDTVVSIANSKFVSSDRSFCAGAFLKVDNNQLTMFPVSFSHANSA
jgi:hypothetical protein